MIHPAAAALEYHLALYRRTWRGTFFVPFVLPVLFLLSIGRGVGGYIDGHAGLGVSYLDYIAPGLLASTALQVGIGEGTYMVFGAFNWSRTYHMMRASPLRTVDILAGHLAFSLLRVTMSATAFVVVMTMFGTMRSATAVLALPAAVLVGFSCTAFMFAFSAVIDSDNMFAVVLRLAMVPMTLFAGVFFPVSAMPVAARALAYVSPLWHGVELCRAATLGRATAWGAPVHAGYLMIWIVGGFLVANRAFARKLTD